MNASLLSSSDHRGLANSTTVLHPLVEPVENFAALNLIFTLFTTTKQPQ